MAQEFEYPNMLSGTRGTMYRNYVRDTNACAPVALAGAPGGMAFALENATANEKFIWASRVLGGKTGVTLRHGATYTLSAWMARTENMVSTDVFVLAHGTSEDGWVAAQKNGFVPAVGGGWLSWSFSLPEKSKEEWGYDIRFDNNASTDGEAATLWVADVMLVEGTEPRAWAPAEGETLVGGGVLS